MTLASAKQLRDQIREANVHSIVPLGHGPDGYFARIFLHYGETRDFYSEADWLSYRDEKEKAKAARLAEQERQRNPVVVGIYAMIDKACGR